MSASFVMRDAFRDKADVLTVACLAACFAAFFRSLVGATTFQTDVEMLFLVASCIALLVVLQLLCVFGRRRIRSMIVPAAMSLGALVDVAFGMVFGRASTAPITFVLLVVGCATACVLYVRFFKGDDDGWKGHRKACSYDALAFPLVYLAVFVLVLGGVFGCLFMMHVGGLNRGVSQLGFFVGCLLSGFVVAAPLLLFQNRSVEILAKITLLFMIAGLSLILLVQPSFMSLLVLAVGFCCFVHVVMRMVFGYYRAFALPALFSAGYLLVLLLAIVAGLLIGRLLVLSGLEAFDAFTIASMLLLNVTSIIGLGTNHFWDVDAVQVARDGAGEPASESRVRLSAGWWRRALEGIAQEAGLTPREQEVLALMAKGRNASYIEQHLVISNHTARAHILRIYKKLDVHSQQAVIDMVEQRVSEMKRESDAHAMSV